jgi:hypothetical protein
MKILEYLELNWVIICIEELFEDGKIKRYT